MGTENLKTLQYSGSGSAATPGQPLVPVKSYKSNMDLNAGAARVEIVRFVNDAPFPQVQTIGSSSPWDTQYDFWLTPYGFLKGAMSHETTLKPETVSGQKYNVLSYNVQDKRVSGYVNEQNMVERVETKIGNDVLAQHVYLQYQDFSGLKFPTIVIQKKNDENTLILVVDTVKPNAPVSIQSGN